LKSRRLPFAWFAAALALGALALGWAAGRLRSGGQTPGAGRGELVYRTGCASCHGADGRGDGAAAAELRPPPRDFAARPWRTELSREAIRKVILEGIPGTAMPASAAALDPRDVAPLVEYVYHLATSRPPVVEETTPRQQLLRTVGFIDLNNSIPPPLVLTDVTGRTVKLSELKGRLVLIHFWGTDCPHCLKEMPHLKKLETEYAGRGLTVLHVCADADDIRSAQATADRTVSGIRVLMDDSGLGLARYEVGALPAVWLIDAEGKAIGRSQGAKDWTSASLRRLIEHCLPDSAGELPLK
jgi:mono/diheme cytochrome c family protein/thiol-disulfide isomerase/thioredoxin